MNLISWNTTNMCNMRCEHCYRRAGDFVDGTKPVRIPPDELQTDEAKRMIEEIARAGFNIMIFSGGEPMTRPDLCELGAYAKSQGLIPVLGTNATLATKELARDLAEAGFVAAGVSLDSLSEDKLSDFRKLPCTKARTLEGIRNLQEAGLKIQIHTTIMNWNKDELNDLCNFAVEIGAVAHHFFFLVPTGRAIEMEGAEVSQADYERAIRWIMKKQTEVDIELKPVCAPQFIRAADQLDVKTRFRRGCLAGTSYCIIGPYGDVRPCAYLNNTLGNVKEIAFDKIWANHPVLKQMRTFDLGGKCGKCEYRTSCVGCRARAFYDTGDFMAEDPNCVYKPQAVRDDIREERRLARS